MIGDTIPIWLSHKKQPCYITVYGLPDRSSFGGFVRSYTREQRESKEWDLRRRFNQKPKYRINIREKDLT